MKALSVHQPWAWAIFHAGKNVENRNWATRHRGPLLIHAAKSERSLSAIDPTEWLKRFGLSMPERSVLTFGAILGVVDVVGCVTVGPGDDLDPFGQSVWAEEGLFGWVLRNPRIFTDPVPFRGAQRLFDVP